MSDLIKELVTFAITEETVPGTPDSVSGADFINISEDGIAMNQSVDAKEVNTLSGNRLETKTRKTIKNGDGAGATFLKAGESEGDIPETDVIMRAFGFSLESVVQGDVISVATNVITVASGDELKYKVGQTITLKENGIDFSSPITLLADGAITLLLTPSESYTSAAKTAVMSCYRLDGEEDTAFTARKFFNGEVKQQVPFCIPSNITIDNIVSGEIPKFGFTFAGINFTEVLETLGVTPDLMDTEVPFALDACLYKDGVAIEASEVSFSFEQTLSKKMTLCASNGSSGQRKTGRYATSGSLNVYKNDQAIEFPINDTEFSLFISLYVPGAVSGDKENLVSIYIPVVKCFEKDSNGDSDGQIFSAVSFKAEPTSDEDTFPVISFS